MATGHCCLWVPLVHPISQGQHCRESAGCPDGGRCCGSGVPAVLPQSQAAEGSVCAAVVTAVQRLKEAILAAGN